MILSAEEIKNIARTQLKNSKMSEKGDTMIEKMISDEFIKIGEPGIMITTKDEIRQCAISTHNKRQDMQHKLKYYDYGNVDYRWFTKWKK